jgi:putative endonuclease
LPRCSPVATRLPAPPAGGYDEGKQINDSYYFWNMVRGGYAYIMSNTYNTVIYVGSTADLRIRVYQHKTKEFPNSFTARYNIDKLVYFEYFDFIVEAIAREKQIKSWSRKKKDDLIEKINPERNDLFPEIEKWD